MRPRLCCFALLLLLGTCLGQRLRVSFKVNCLKTSIDAAPLVPLVLTSLSNACFNSMSNTGEVTNVTAPEIYAAACPVGAYSVVSSGTCTLCGAGTYSSSPSASASEACVACAAGTFSTARGSSDASVCEACAGGTYSTALGGVTSDVCQPCVLNSTSAPGASSAELCVCNQGYEGGYGAACAGCNVSTWCASGRAHPCPPHSLSSGLAGSIAQCMCLPGYFEDVGNPSLCEFCKEDFYCPGGEADVAVVCPGGEYSLAGSDALGDCSCPANASSLRRSSQVTACECLPGFHRVNDTASQPAEWRCVLCPPDEFCMDGVVSPCPVHSTSAPGSDSPLDCVCNPGYLNTTDPPASCDSCPTGFYCPGGGAISACVHLATSPLQAYKADQCFCELGYVGQNNTPCANCSAGSFCYAGASTLCAEGSTSAPLSWLTDNCTCLPGHRGPPGGPCVQCAAGSYNPSRNASECLPCPPGSASPLGAESCGVCPPGQYSGGGGTPVCLPCAAGSFSTLENASSCAPCGAGEYAGEGSLGCSRCGSDGSPNSKQTAPSLQSR